MNKKKLETHKYKCIKILYTYRRGNETKGKTLASAVFLPALSFVVARNLAGGGLWASQVSKKEANARQGIFKACMTIRSYAVYSEK